jgi:uncharacterized protein YceK
MEKTKLLVVIVVGLAVMLGGCASYYQVSDVTTGKVYYTKDIDGKKGGAIGFEDAKTKSRITLQSTEVKKINKEKFNVGVYSEK